MSVDSRELRSGSDCRTNTSGLRLRRDPVGSRTNTVLIVRNAATLAGLIWSFLPLRQQLSCHFSPRILRSLCSIRVDLDRLHCTASSCWVSLFLPYDSARSLPTHTCCDIFAVLDKLYRVLRSALLLRLRFVFRGTLWRSPVMRESGPTMRGNNSTRGSCSMSSRDCALCPCWRPQRN